MKVPEKYRRLVGILSSNITYGNNGVFEIEGILCIASDGGGWEHVSVALPKRTPTWEEMCFIKDIFWEKEQTVVQFHPKESEYVNNHPYVLHLWKKSGEAFALPPKQMI